MRRYKVVLLTLAVAAPLAAQTPIALTDSDYARAEKFLAATAVPLTSGIPGRPTWLDDGLFWYRKSTATGFEFVVVDPAKKTREAAFDHGRIAQALTAATRGNVDRNRFPFQTFERSKDGREMVVTVGSRRYKCSLQAYACSPADTVATTAAAPANSVASPDGRRAAFIRDYNLWVKDLSTGAESQLTTDGIQDFGYATNNAGWTKSDAPLVSWSPDSKKIATFQHDGRGTSNMYLVRTKVGEPELESWKYPLPGDSVIFRIHRVIVDVDGRRVVRLQMPPDAHRSTVSDHIACGSGLCDLEWYPDGSSVAFVSSSRDHKHAWMRVADANTGAVRTLLEETSATQLGDASFPENLWRVLPESKELIWWSQRDNWVQLYLYDLVTGKLKNRITSGEGNVTDIQRVDAKSRIIYFVANGKERGRDPYLDGLYRVRFDGKGQSLLTPENANHSVSVATDGRSFVDTYSTSSTPPVSVLRDMSGRAIMLLEKADVSRLVASGWKPPTPFTVKARDGQTDIYGLMFTPSGLDSSKRYPIINYIYPGPQAGSVGSRSFSPAQRDHQALAELGFVVVAIDGMGTPGRSKKFADAYYGRMGDNTLPDQVAGMKQLAERYRFIDLSRVGIWGHSGGGFAAAGAMFRYPDFFKVGIAESGNHDNRNYEDDWGERYHALLVRSGSNGDNYTAEANQTYAKNLKGKLMLAHGGLDNNVPPSNTYLVVDALIAANKDFDLLILPNQRHGYASNSNYMMRRRWDYFVKNLLGAEPPKEYQIGGSAARR